MSGADGGRDGDGRTTTRALPAQPALQRGVFAVYRTFWLATHRLGGVRITLPFLAVALTGSALVAAFIFPFFRVVDLVGSAVFAPRLAASGGKLVYLALSTALTVGGLVLILVAIAGHGGAALVALFFAGVAVAGLGNGLNSVADKSVMGDLWSGRERSTLIGEIQVYAGLAGLAAILLSTYAFAGDGERERHIHLLEGATLTASFALAAVLVLAVRRPATGGTRAATAGGGWLAMIRDALKAPRLSWFRRLSLVRLMLLSVEFGATFFAIHTATFLADHPLSLTAFAAFAALGAIVGGALARWIVSRSERACLVVAGMLGAGSGLAAVLIEAPPGFPSVPAYCTIFFLLGVADACLTTGRLGYYLAFAMPGDRERGVVMTALFVDPLGGLFVVSLGVLAHLEQPIPAIVLLTALSTAGVATALSLPQVVHGGQGPRSRFP